MKKSEVALLFAAVWLAPLNPDWINQTVGITFAIVALARMLKGE